VDRLAKTGSPRIAFFDIETAPIKGYTWTMYDTNVVSVTKPTYMLCFAVKWAHQKTVKTYALPDYPLYKKDRENDRELAKELWRVMDEADIIIAHNGDSFDIKKANARFITHGLTPPAPGKSIDTLKIARKCFKFDSNKLDSIGGYLGVGRKLPHTGIHLWLGCMNGDPKAWRMMRRYNAQDVRLLEQVYLKVRAWAGSHPNLTLYEDGKGCPTCRSQNIQRRGITVAKSVRRQRFQCQDCGAWCSGEMIKGYQNGRR
jgi:uncharacterized protein YprB with RNaseH-like and TPR domain